MLSSFMAVSICYDTYKKQVHQFNKTRLRCFTLLKLWLTNLKYWTPKLQVLQYSFSQYFPEH
jgi:hypothetical protein